jgi:hypothetical protein
MILSKQKQNFVLNKVIEAINISHSYDMDNMSYSKTFHLKYILTRGNSYKVSLYFYKTDKTFTLSKITLCFVLPREEGNVEIELDGNDIKFKTIEELMYNKVKEIDDVKFKKIFPEYDLMEERNDILDELLNQGSEEQTENKEVEVEEVEEVEEKVIEKKTSWFRSFFSIPYLSPEN